MGWSIIRCKVSAYSLLAIVRWGVMVNVPSHTWWHKVGSRKSFSCLHTDLQKALLLPGVQVATCSFICPYMLTQEINCFPYRLLCFFAMENGGWKCSITSAFSVEYLAKNSFGWSCCTCVDGRDMELYVEYLSHCVLWNCRVGCFCCAQSLDLQKTD